MWGFKGRTKVSCVPWVLLLWLGETTTTMTEGFLVSPRIQITNSYQSAQRTTITILGSSENGLAESSSKVYFPDLPVMDFLLTEHKPLGCTAEESVAMDKQFPNAKFVFVSKIVDGGNAEKAGLQPGDVIVGISGTFNDVVPVAGLGLEQVRSLVGGRLDTEPLTLEIVRGTNVLSDHQTALVDLCLMPDEEREVSINQKLSEFLKSGYCDDDDDDESASAGEEECNPDSDADCLVDSMYQDWHNDFEEDDADFQEQDLEEMDNNNNEPTKPNPAPWSSRSSPSGTFVQDPATGKLRNIDAP